jgi:hypothetical protein
VNMALLYKNMALLYMNMALLLEIQIEATFHFMCLH